MNKHSRKAVSSNFVFAFSSSMNWLALILTWRVDGY